MTLNEVLAAHWEYGPTADFDGWECSCGERISDTREGALDEDMQAHVAEQVTAWVREQLGAAGMREAVAEALRTRDARGPGVWPWVADADIALAAVAAGLTGGAA